mmetsp:Transcript_1073/g.2462  ORF Transcript_1073/g.2462 Transcript_1073/m.2462 type:complete len:202 (-) Transcript_1073:1221-1826(-)
MSSRSALGAARANHSGQLGQSRGGGGAVSGDGTVSSAADGVADGFDSGARFSRHGGEAVEGCFDHFPLVVIGGSGSGIVVVRGTSSVGSSDSGTSISFDGHDDLRQFLQIPRPHQKIRSNQPIRRQSPHLFEIRLVHVQFFLPRDKRRRIRHPLQNHLDQPPIQRGCQIGMPFRRGHVLQSQPRLQHRHRHGVDGVGLKRQ